MHNPAIEDKNFIHLLGIVTAEVDSLLMHWHILENLYGQEANVRLLDRAAPKFFTHVLGLLLESLIVRICRLTEMDKASTKYKGQSCTLEYVISRDAEISKTFRPRLEAFKTTYAEIIKARNKQIGHLDRQTNLQILTELIAVEQHDEEGMVMLTLPLQSALEDLSGLLLDVVEAYGLTHVFDNEVKLARDSGTAQLIGFLKRAEGRRRWREPKNTAR